MRIRDKDGNQGQVSVVTFGPYDEPRNEPVVGICADGLWLTPAQARRFARAILSAAERVAAKRAKKR